MTSKRAQMSIWTNNSAALIDVPDVLARDGGGKAKTECSGLCALHDEVMEGVLINRNAVWDNIQLHAAASKT